MTDIDKLIEELRNLGALAPAAKYRESFTKAADTIVAQSKRIEELEKQLQWNDTVVNGAVVTLQSMNSEMSEDTIEAWEYSDDVENVFSTLSENYKTLNGGSDNG